MLETTAISRIPETKNPDDKHLKHYQLDLIFVVTIKANVLFHFPSSKEFVGHLLSHGTPEDHLLGH